MRFAIIPNHVFKCRQTLLQLNSLETISKFRIDRDRKFRHRLFTSSKKGELRDTYVQ